MERYALDEWRRKRPALLYNDGRARAEAERIAAVADRDSAAHGVNGGLAKLLRARALAVPLPAPAYTEAAFGAALLARVAAAP